MEQSLEMFRGELRHIAEALSGMNPGTEEYGRALDQYRTCLFEVRELERRLRYPGEDPNAVTPWGTCTAPAEEEMAKPAAETPATEPEAPDAPWEEPGAEPAPAKEEVVDWAKYRAELHGRLAEARLNAGLNTAALLASIGAVKFSSVPDEKLPELSGLLDQALKEKT